jgi:hypothetical protein
VKDYDLPPECANVPTLEEWVNQEGDVTCKPCVLPIALGWYADALEEHGEAARAAELRQIMEGPDIPVLQLAQQLDRIKAEVTGGLRTYLKEMDCTLQLNADSI